MVGPRDKSEIIQSYEAELAQLKRMWDLYFQGIERLPPVQDRDEFKKAITKQKAKTGSWRTRDKFRFNAVYNKLLSFDRMWERQMKQIEDGTHPRERARRRQAKRDAEKAAALAAKNPQDNRAALAAAKAAAKAAGGGLDDAKVKKIYDVYMQAKKRTGERSTLTVDALKKQLSKQVPAIKKKHGCKDVEFKVVLKNGKAMLKAVPK
jgi:hypothetical protein